MRIKYLYKMLLQLTKNTGKLNIIKYIRDNGTETWMYSDDFFIRHDLSHFALEKILGYTTAFNGMINNGMDIKDFENREKRATLTVTAEAYYAENMANLFLMEIVQGNLNDFNAVQQTTFELLQLSFPKIMIPDGKLNEIRLYLQQLLQQWKELPAGETLELSFSL